LTDNNLSSFNSLILPFVPRGMPFAMKERAEKYPGKSLCRPMIDLMEEERMEKTCEGEVNTPASGEQLISQATAVREDSMPRGESLWEGYSLSTLSVFFDNC
jgi:hypothetical protein